MDQALPDLLLLIFAELNSREMVSVRRVERKWLQIINETKTLWTELVLPRRKFQRKGWGLQALELFDQKSNSTLKRVSVEVGPGVESGPFVEILERSKDTLRVLEINGEDLNYKVERALKASLWKFQNLVDCRLTQSPYTGYYNLRLQLGERENDGEDDRGSSLRILWISDLKKLSKSHFYLLDNLVSFVFVEDSYGSLRIRRILKRSSRTLKHLEITIENGEERQIPKPQIPTLSFPNLKFLDIDLGWNHDTSVFPSWMKLPSLSTLIIRNPRTLSSLPACSKLWLVGLDEFDDLLGLASQCPELVELRMNFSEDPRGDEWGGELSPRERSKNLSSMLSQRKVNVENEMEIESVKMIKLRTLVVPFDMVEPLGEDGLETVGLLKLRESVEEVVNLHKKRYESSDIIEMVV